MVVVAMVEGSDPSFFCGGRVSYSFRKTLRQIKPAKTTTCGTKYACHAPTNKYATINHVIHPKGHKVVRLDARQSKPTQRTTGTTMCKTREIAILGSHPSPVFIAPTQPNWKANEIGLLMTSQTPTVPVSSMIGK